MKLNMDCVRAVMLCAEEYTDYNHYCYFISYQKNNVNDFLLDDPETPPAYQLELEKTYDNDDLFYAVEYCVKSGFVETLFSKDTYRIPISRITPDVPCPHRSLSPSAKFYWDFLFCGPNTHGFAGQGGYNAGQVFLSFLFRQALQTRPRFLPLDPRFPRRGNLWSLD